MANLTISFVSSYDELKQLMKIKTWKCPSSLRKLYHTNCGIAIGKVDEQIVSFLYYCIENNSLLISYSYTLPLYRGKGYNTELRKFIISFATNLKLDYVKSVPFPNADSISILKNLGFIERYGVYVLPL